MATFCVCVQSRAKGKIITFLKSNLKTLFVSTQIFFVVRFPCHKFTFFRFIHQHKSDNYVHYVEKTLYLHQHSRVLYGWINFFLNGTRESECDAMHSKMYGAKWDQSLARNRNDTHIWNARMKLNGTRKNELRIKPLHKMRVKKAKEKRMDKW